MCIDTVSPPNVSRYGDISIYCCISNTYTVHIYTYFMFTLTLYQCHSDKTV